MYVVSASCLLHDIISYDSEQCHMIHMTLFSKYCLYVYLSQLIILKLKVAPSSVRS